VNIIAHTAEECNRIPTASNNKNTAPAESGFTPEDTSDGSQDTSGKRHSFSFKLAREIQKLKGDNAGNGCHEAIVIKYLSNRSSKARNDVGGKKWFYIKLKEIKNHYPYLSTSTIRNIVHTLKAIGYCEIANHNKYKYDRTFWYHVPARIRNACEEELRYFDAEIAAEVGVPAAVLIDNFQYWIRQCEEKGVECRVRMSPRILIDLLPFSESTIKRGLKTMIDKAYAIKLSETKPLFGKPNIKSGSKVISLGSNVIQDGSNVISVGSNVTDDTYCKPINNPLEICSKEKTASSSLKLLSSAEDDDYSSQVIIPHDADGQNRDVMEHDEDIPPASDILITPSTLDIPGSADNVKGTWPQIENYEKLRKINRFNNTIALALEAMPAGRTMLTITVHDICMNVLKQMDEETADRLYCICDADELVDALLPYHHAALDQCAIDPNGDLFDLFYFGSFETIVGAIIWTETPADLLRIMDQCIQAYIKEPAPPKKFARDVMWNTRKGATSVLLFSNLLSAIIRELHITDCPIEKFLGDIIREHEEQEDEEAMAA